MKKTIASACFTLALLAGSALAHQTYLQPQKFNWSVGDKVEIIMTSALSFPDLLSGPSPDRIAFARIMVGGKELSDFSYQEEETFLTISFDAAESGMAVAALSSKIREGAIEPKDVEMYLGEIGASDAVRQAFLDLPGDPALNRSYRKHTKTFFCVDDCDNGKETATEPVGQSLEFIAMDGKHHSFQLVLEGAPLANHEVQVVTADKTATIVTSSDKGIVDLDHALSGPTMMMAVWITLPDQPDGIYHSDYATLVVDLPEMQHDMHKGH